MNVDAKLIHHRQELFEREQYFVKQSQKHFHQLCDCAKKKKVCRMEGTLDLHRLGDGDYVSELYRTGIFDTVYNICQSITQSMRCRSGKDFENGFQEILKDEGFHKGIHYSSQVYITKDLKFSFHKYPDSHAIDFVIPSPVEGIDIREFRGNIISFKTTLRERWLQDRYIPHLTIISLESKQVEGVECICVKPNGNELETWLQTIKQTYLFPPQKSMNVLDLFCGSGGLTQGLKEAGFNIVLGVDSWNVAIESYQHNFEHPSLCMDLAQLSPQRCQDMFGLREIDVIVGGPPCQGFSMAGKRDKNDPRNSLFMEFVRYLEFFQPKMFLFENVMGILSMKTQEQDKSIDIIMEQLRIHYHCIISKLYASDFEVPQNRRRVIIIGIHKRYNVHPSEPSLIIKHKRDRIPISSVLETKESVNPSFYLSEKARLGIQLKKERMVRAGKGFGAQFIQFDKPCFTIPARYWKDGYDALVKYNDSEIRRLTITELKRIQTFPESFEFCGSSKEQIIQIGNAVPCRFAYHLGNHLLRLASLISKPKN